MTLEEVAKTLETAKKLQEAVNECRRWPNGSVNYGNAIQVLWTAYYAANGRNGKFIPLAALWEWVNHQLDCTRSDELDDKIQHTFSFFVIKWEDKPGYFDGSHIGTSVEKAIHYSSRERAEQVLPRNAEIKEYFAKPVDMEIRKCRKFGGEENAIGSR